MDDIISFKHSNGTSSHFIWNKSKNLMEEISKHNYHPQKMDSIHNVGNSPLQFSGQRYYREPLLTEAEARIPTPPSMHQIEPTNCLNHGQNTRLHDQRKRQYRFNETEKLDILRAIKISGIKFTKAAGEYGISPGTLYNWQRKLHDKIFPDFTRTDSYLDSILNITGNLSLLNGQCVQRFKQICKELLKLDSTLLLMNSKNSRLHLMDSFDRLYYRLDPQHFHIQLENIAYFKNSDLPCFICDMLRKYHNNKAAFLEFYNKLIPADWHGENNDRNYFLLKIFYLNIRGLTTVLIEENILIEKTLAQRRALVYPPAGVAGFES